MSKGQKIITTVLWTVLACAILGITAFKLWKAQHDENAASVSRVQVEPPLDDDGQLPRLFTTPAFSLIDQNAKPITDADLRGNVWVAAFIFTNCAGPCPMMSAKMAELQMTVTEPNVKLVSISVDPQRDTPAVLKQYAQKFGADESRWHFITGEKPKVYEFIQGMKVTSEPIGENDILHETRFLLVDSQGQVRGIYSMNDAVEMNQLATDARTLARQGTEVAAP